MLRTVSLVSLVVLVLVAVGLTGCTSVDDLTPGSMIETQEEAAAEAWRDSELIEPSSAAVSPSEPTAPDLARAGGCGGEPPGTRDFCDVICPCDDGEGDCDSDAECATGTRCSADVGAAYGWNPLIDVCETWTDCHLPANLGTSTYCSPTCPCAHGEGDCDSDAECYTGTRCVMDVGANYGWNPGIDVCEAYAVGSATYCTTAMPCSVDEGDCDSDAECAAGVCWPDIGADYGWNSMVDVCRPLLGCHTTPGSYFPGTSAFCSASCQCADGEGDCDNDGECLEGTVCVHDVGATYGFNPLTDVCLAP